MDIRIKNKLNELESQVNCAFKAEEFLEWYYDEYIGHQSDSICGKYDLDAEDIAYPEELTEPMVARSSGINEAMKRIVKHGCDLNLGSISSPLMLSVGWCDAPMTELLLQNGADANIWAEMINGECNYYLEDLDIAYLNERWDRTDSAFVDALLSTAKILVTTGRLSDYHDFCLSIDTKTQTISVDRPHYRYNSEHSDSLR